MNKITMLVLSLTLGTACLQTVEDPDLATPQRLDTIVQALVGVSSQPATPVVATSSTDEQFAGLNLGTLIGVVVAGAVVLVAGVAGGVLLIKRDYKATEQDKRL